MTHAVLVNILRPESLLIVSTVPTGSAATQANPPTSAPRPSLTNFGVALPPRGIPVA